MAEITVHHPETVAGDPFVTAAQAKLERLEERFHNELMDEEERLELHERILHLRKKASQKGGE